MWFERKQHTVYTFAQNAKFTVTTWKRAPTGFSNSWIKTVVLLNKVIFLELIVDVACLLTKKLLNETSVPH